MSTDSRSLPERDFLDMGVSLYGIHTARHPRPCYRVCYRLRMYNAGRSSLRLRPSYRSGRRSYSRRSRMARSRSSSSKRRLASTRSRKRR